MRSARRRLTSRQRASDNSFVVLIVEDDEDTRVAYQEFLELLGFPAACVGTGTAALEIVRTQPIDAVLLDLTLPDIDGRVLCERLREAASSPPLRVMALTGHTLDEAERRKFEAVLRKPVDLDAVAAWLRGLPPLPTSPRGAT